MQWQGKLTRYFLLSHFSTIILVFLKSQILYSLRILDLCCQNCNLLSVKNVISLYQKNHKIVLLINFHKHLLPRETNFANFIIFVQKNNSFGTYCFIFYSSRMNYLYKVTESFKVVTLVYKVIETQQLSYFAKLIRLPGYYLAEPVSLRDHPIIVLQHCCQNMICQNQWELWMHIGNMY